MNKIYMTFLTEMSSLSDYKSGMTTLYEPLNVSENGVMQTDLTEFLYDKRNDYFVSYEPVNDICSKKKLKNSLGINERRFKGDKEVYYGIRPVIKTTGSLETFIRKNSIKDLGNDEYMLGYYPQEVVTDKNLIQELRVFSDYNEKDYSIPKYSFIVPCKGVTYKGEDYIYISGKNTTYVKVQPLIWKYDKESNSLICKNIIAGFLTKTKPKAFLHEGFDFLNEYLLRDIFKGSIKSLTDNVKVCNEIIQGDLQRFYLPYEGAIEMDEEGKLYSHDEKTYEINIGPKVKVISSNAVENLFDNCHKDGKFGVDINIKSDDLTILSQAFDFSKSGIDVFISHVNIDAKKLSLAEKVFSNANMQVVPRCDEVSISCDIKLFARLYLSGNKVARNLLDRSFLKINYTSERELVSFLNDVQRFVNLFSKYGEKYTKNEYNPKKRENNKIDFVYKHDLYEFSHFDLVTYNCKSENLFYKLHTYEIVLSGPKINEKRVSSFFKDYARVKFEFTDKKAREESADIVEDESLTKEAEHILDLAREIMSIDYIGLDKENVKTKVKNIVGEYNNSLSKKTEGLSLTTNNGVYTNAVIKLENLRDSLYYNFEKNLDYYDILDLIKNMIKKLNDEKVNLDYEILKDLDTLNKILDYNNDNNTRKEIITYLENERQFITAYLSGKAEIEYKNIDEFVKKFRLFLVPILARVSGDVSKIDVMEQIKDYAIEEMNNKTSENTNSYIKIILSEIDITKHLILELDSNYTFEELDYSSFKTGKEIIDYLDKKYMEYYKIYLNLMENKVNEENYENSKVHLNI